VLLIPEAALVYDKDKTFPCSASIRLRGKVAQAPVRLHLQRQRRGLEGLKAADNWSAVTAGGEILIQTVRNIWAHKLRSTLTMFGISWGLLHVFMSPSAGFQGRLSQHAYSMGTAWSSSGRRTTKQAGGQRAGRDVRFTLETSGRFSRNAIWCGMSLELAGSSRMRAGSFRRFLTHGITPIYSMSVP